MIVADFRNQLQATFTQGARLGALAPYFRCFEHNSRTWQMSLNTQDVLSLSPALGHRLATSTRNSLSTNHIASASHHRNRRSRTPPVPADLTSLPAPIHFSFPFQHTTILQLTLMRPHFIGLHTPLLHTSLLLGSLVPRHSPPLWTHPQTPGISGSWPNGFKRLRAIAERRLNGKRKAIRRRVLSAYSTPSRHSSRRRMAPSRTSRRSA